jgi:hypothetical protein
VGGLAGGRRVRVFEIFRRFHVARHGRRESDICAWERIVRLRFVIVAFVVKEARVRLLLIELNGAVRIVAQRSLAGD